MESNLQLSVEELNEIRAKMLAATKDGGEFDMAQITAEMKNRRDKIASDNKVIEEEGRVNVS